MSYTHWSLAQKTWSPGPGSVSPTVRCAAAGLCSAAAAGELEPGPLGEP